MSEPGQTIVRLSLRWVFVGTALVLIMAVLGGILGANLQPPPSILTTQSDRLVSTVQKVTLSPNVASQAIVEQHERSILLLAHGSRTNPVALAVAPVVTNDGIVATMHQAVHDEVFGIDSSGTYITLDALGTDPVYGVMFYRVHDSVFSPVELATADGAVGNTFLALARSATIAQPEAHIVSLEQYELPKDNDPPGWFRVARLATPENVLTGTPMLSDDGAMVGIVVGSDSKRMLPVSYLRQSLGRLAAGKREVNPFDTWGFTVQPSFAVLPTQTGIVFTVTVKTVDTKKAPQLRPNDHVLAVNDQPLTWQTDLIGLLSAAPPINLTLERAGQMQQVALTVPSPTP